MQHTLLAAGFRYAGVVSGLRSEPNRRDIAVIASDLPATAAGVYTQNRVVAAPVVVSRERTPRADARAIVVCSGNANACTGEQGLKDARRMAEIVAQDLGCDPEQVLVASTGVIGRPLPMAVLEAGVPKAVAALSAGGLDEAAHAILTTDTKIKLSSRKVGPHTVTGFAKGAAMIGPNLATMLGFVLTDAPLPTDTAQHLLRRAADKSFNCISVEGHTSTNDTVFLLANGAVPEPIPDLFEFSKALDAVCADLAKQIAADAEGAQHLITIRVTGTATEADARTIAKAVAESALVKTAVYGADPNWGRIVSAAGYAGVAFEEKDLSLKVGEYALYSKGTPLPFDAARVSKYLKDHRDVTFDLTFTLGAGACTYYTSDLTPDYVTLNADYTT